MPKSRRVSIVGSPVRPFPLTSAPDAAGAKMPVRKSTRKRKAGTADDTGAAHGWKGDEKSRFNENSNDNDPSEFTA